MRLGGSVGAAATIDKPAAIDQVAPVDEAGPAAAEPKLHHEPALDGLRGLAVAAVLLFHLERLDGGFLGVDLFFVLSGFLITSLLVVERQGRGRINLARFWVRRARRLFPALLVLIVGVSGLLLTLAEESERARFRGEALATLGYVANWHRMNLDIGYWDIFSQPSPFDHTWSLAIEEQFYVAWPVLTVLFLGLLAGRVRALGVLALAGAAISFVLLAVHYSEIDTSRAYYGTDSRIGATLLGCGLACFVARRARRTAAPRRTWELAGMAGFGVMTWSLVFVDGLASWYYRGGLVVFALASVAVIHTVTGGPPGLLGRAISWTPLRGLGVISYGVYLWHWPVNVFLTPERWHREGWSLDVARVSLTLVVALVSYYVIERPIRRGALHGWSIRLATTGALTVTLVVALVATSGEPPATGNDAHGLGRVPVEGSNDPYLLYPAQVPPGDMKVLLVGDSGAYFLGPHLAEEGRRLQTTVASSAPYHCNVAIPEGVDQLPDGTVMNREECAQQRHKVWSTIIDELDPDAVVYYMANAGAPGRVLLDGEWARDCESAFDSYMTDALADEAALLGSGGARVFLATSPYSKIPEEDAMDRIDCRNAVVREVAESGRNLEVLDMNAFVEPHDKGGEVEMFRDMVHLSDRGSVLVSDWLLGEIRTRLGMG